MLASRGEEYIEIVLGVNIRVREVSPVIIAYPLWVFISQ
jgi:hypothetical protein